MFTSQLIISFVVFGCLFFLMTVPDQNKNNKQETAFDDKLSPKIIKSDKNNVAAVKITFCLFLIGMIYLIYNYNNSC